MPHTTHNVRTQISHAHKKHQINKSNVTPSLQGSNKIHHQQLKQPIIQSSSQECRHPGHCNVIANIWHMQPNVPKWFLKNEGNAYTGNCQPIIHTLYCQFLTNRSTSKWCKQCTHDCYSLISNRLYGSSQFIGSQNAENCHIR